MMNDDYDLNFDPQADAHFEMESAKEREAQEKCEHEWEGVHQPGSPSGPDEYFEVCKHCGMENPGSWVEDA